MALDASSFKSTIEALPNGSEVLAFHAQMVEAERNRGIEESRKANAEAQAMRKFKIALEKLPGFNKDVDLDQYVDGLIKTTTKAADADTAKTSLEQVVKELNTLKADFGKTQAELQAERQRAETLKADAIKKTIKAKLTSVLSDKVYGHDFVIDSLINAGQVVLGDNETVEFVDGDKRLSLDIGLQRLTEQRPDIVKNTQRPGAGSTPPTGGTTKTFTLEQIQGMDKETIRANLADVKKSLGITS